jgi:pilus assembly protein CpaF
MSFATILPYFPAEIRALLLDESVSDLMVNGTRGVFVDRNGAMEQVTLRDPFSRQGIETAIRHVARNLGKDLSEDTPIIDTRLPDGSRVAVVGAPSSVDGPTLTVRKFARWFTTDELIEKGTMRREVRDAIVEMIGRRKNGLISGSTGSGKTTVLKAFLDHIPPQERLILIESPSEIRVDHRNAVRWEAVDPAPGVVGISMMQLVAASLRHRPDRIIVGETRDECAYALLQSMNTGHGGSLSTVHANSGMDALYRLANLALTAKPNLHHDFVRWDVSRAIDFVLHCDRAPDGTRRADELLGVEKYDSATGAFVTSRIV